MYFSGKLPELPLHIILIVWLSCSMKINLVTGIMLQLSRVLNVFVQALH